MSDQPNSPLTRYQAPDWRRDAWELGRLPRTKRVIPYAIILAAAFSVAVHATILAVFLGFGDSEQVVERAQLTIEIVPERPRPRSSPPQQASQPILSQPVEQPPPAEVASAPPEPNVESRAEPGAEPIPAPSTAPTPVPLPVPPPPSFALPPERVALPDRPQTPPAGPVTPPVRFEPPQLKPALPPMEVASAPPKPPPPEPRQKPSPPPVPTPDPLPVASPKPQPAPVEEVVRLPPMTQPANAQARYHDAELGNKPPDYPQIAREQGHEGRVIIAVTVATTGQAQRVWVAESSGVPLLDRVALQAVGKWRFLPARRDGRVIQSNVVVPISFRLKN